MAREKGGRRGAQMLARFALIVLPSSVCVGAPLEYAPAPPDNPLRGLVPYVSASGKEQFPHSMEFSYFSLKDLMKGPREFDWAPIERTLAEVSSRGNQLIFRIYCEYPGKEIAVPSFLIDAGLGITKWPEQEEKETQVSYTPDYESPLLREALTNFISALGDKYDGDPRVAFITVGLLGSWGEWHTFPRNDLWASKLVQGEVMDAYARAFSETKLLLRYPVGSDREHYAENHNRPFGYHDDSFGWATLDTSDEGDEWHFEPSLQVAGAEDKWETEPIGGEIRPELWKQSFTANRHPRDQGFATCVERLHATWLMDSGLFDEGRPVDEERKKAALTETSQMGYEFHVLKADWREERIYLTVVNRGVAPFYYEWPVEVEVEGKTIETGWSLSELLPGQARVWSIGLGEESSLRIRVPNPMRGGKPLRFANRAQGKEWLVIRP